MPTHLVNKPKLLDELVNFDSFAGLFINSVKENNENPSFIEPNFSGYSLISLDKNKWGPAVKENDYASIKYNSEIFWINNSNLIVTIEGYFIKKTNNDILWFNVFETPLFLSKNEGLYITPIIYLDNNSLFNTFFIFNVVKANPTTLTVLNPTISINNQIWGEVSADDSLINTRTGNNTYSLSKESIILALDKKINPTTNTPFSFTVTAQQPGFYVYTKLINITSPGVYEKTIKLIEVS